MNADCFNDERERNATSGLGRLGWVPVLALLLALPAQAQYKVVGPDGKVTYTDRPPASAAKVTSLSGRGGETGPTDLALPLELRQPASKYPVTLYTVSGACEPCQAARQLLRQRGIPYAEKQVLGAEDSEALERLSGGRDAPTLAIGSQMMRGFAPEVWASYLDAAGYPRESKLPAGYQYAAATPIVERRDAAVPRPAPAASRADAPAVPPPASPTGIKF
jgi:glutaredoxin